MSLGLVEMMRYNAWANDVLLSACRDLTDEQLDHRLGVTSGSTRQLLLHIVGGEQTFVLRTMGRQHEGELDRDSAWPGIASLSDLAKAKSAELVSIADGLDPEREITLPYQDRLYRYPVRFFLVHAAAHGVEHRTEVKLNLADIGFATPDLDGWPYSEWAGYGGEVAEP